MVTHVKICGLTNLADAEAAIEAGADSLGFNFEPSSPRYVGDQDLSWVSPLAVIKVAVFGRMDRELPPNMFGFVQSVEWNAPVAPQTSRIQAVRLRPGQRASDVVESFPSVFAVLLDAYRVDAYGGTGRKVDWDLAAEIVRLSPIQIILAGGLTPDNVAQAVRKVRPYSVDVASGVEERPGVKDAGKVRAFIQAAKGA